jgi:hypothetical protein
MLGLAGGLARGADEAGARALHQHQLQRQQQQDALQLRLHQQQRSVQSPVGDPRQERRTEQIQIEQRQDQQILQYRQSIAPATTQAPDDEGTRRAREAMERFESEQQGQRQLQNFNAPKGQGSVRREIGARVPVPPRELKIPPSDLRTGVEDCGGPSACP